MKTFYFISFPLFFLFFITMMVRLLILNIKFYNYLKLNHIEKWKEITTVFKFGPGWVNSRRGLRFVFNKDDLNDPQIIIMKVKIRHSTILFFAGFIGIPICLFLIFCIFN